MYSDEITTIARHTALDFVRSRVISKQASANVTVRELKKLMCDVITGFGLPVTSVDIDHAIWTLTAQNYIEVHPVAPHGDHVFITVKGYCDRQNDAGREPEPVIIPAVQKSDNARETDKRIRPDKKGTRETI